MQTIDEAWGALRQGDRSRAQLVATQLVECACVDHGPDTPAHARALGDLAAVLVALGDVPGAVRTLQRAASVDGVDEPTTRAQLAHLTNLGEMLLVLGRADEAHAVLESGLHRRRALFGPGHPGLAFGLGPLADAALARGESARAVELTEEALSILEHHQHPALADARAQRAEVGAAAGSDGPLLDDAALDDASDGEVRDLVAAALRRADRRLAAMRSPSGARFAASMLEAVRDQVLRRFGPGDRQLERLYTALSNAHRLAGDHASRIASLIALLALLDAHERVDDAQEASLALALAASEAGRGLEAEGAYVDAVRRLERVSPELRDAKRSQTLRNYGLYLVERGRFAEAEPMLLTATDTATHRLRGQAHVALGVSLQHRGDAVRAREHLDRALAALPADAPEVLDAERHRRALDEGRDCGCAVELRDLAAQLASIASADLPEGLLDRLEVDGRGELEVHLLREASGDEVAQLWRVLRQGMVRLREGLREGRG